MPVHPDSAPLYARVHQHLVVPWAVSLGEDCQQALSTWDARHPRAPLPNLTRLLALLAQQDWLKGDEYDLTTPHERVLAQALSWTDGLAPWAAIQAAADGLAPQVGQAWGLITPCHWLMGHDHLTLLHPDELHLSVLESTTLFNAVRPLFEGEGWALHFGHPTRWYAVHPSLAELPTASLDRLLGRNPDLWMPEHPQARLIKRLQAETQMLLYQHPANEARQAQEQLTVNSFWLSACGTVPADAARLSQRPASLQLADGPRQALLRGDVPAWQSAWLTLDADPLRKLADAAEQGKSVQLTLCGERHALTLSAAEAQGWLQRTVGQIKQKLQGCGARASPQALLAEL